MRKDFKKEYWSTILHKKKKKKKVIDEKLKHNWKHSQTDGWKHQKALGK